MTRKYLVTPLLHPSAILRGQHAKEPAQVLYLSRLQEERAAGVEPELVDINQPPPGSKLFPSLDDLAVFRTELDACVEPAVSLDLENAGQYIICAGLTVLDLATFKTGSTVCLRFRLRGGVRAWSTWDNHLRATEWLWDLLADERITKVMQNGVTHDTPILEEDGFDVRGRLVDTMTLAHCAYSEFPKGLQWIATLYLGAPVWKTLVDEKVEAEGK